MTTHVRKEHSSTEPTTSVRDGSADKTNNVERTKRMEEGCIHVAKHRSQKQERLDAEQLPSAKMPCTIITDLVEIPNFGE